MLSGALILAALLAGTAGAWSPCGFSMVDTLSPAANGDRRRWSLVGAVAFAAGALAGGLATFGGLALAGDALGLGAGVAVALTAAALIAAAAGDAGGRRIVPQVRRQVPESWRRHLPVPIAGGLYGVLLGLGFTTFVLSFATYALAAACLALGDPATGLAVGLAFGAGRALPVVALAPLQDRDGPAAIAEAMAERPAILHALRAGAAAALLAAAAALVMGAAPAQAASPDLFTERGSDPSAGGALVAWESTTGEGLLLRDGATVALPGRDPAVSSESVAWIADGAIVIADARTLQPQRTVSAPGAEEIALGERLLAWRTRDDGRDVVVALDLATAGAAPFVIGVAARGGRLGRPAVDGTRIAFHVAKRTRSQIFMADITTGERTVVREERGAVLLNPSLTGNTLVYVRSSARRQAVLAGPVGDPEDNRVLYDIEPTARRDAGREPGLRDHRQGYPRGKRPPKPARPRRGLTITLWTTAATPTTVYVTRLRHRRSGVTEPSILRMPLG